MAPKMPPKMAPKMAPKMTSEATEKAPETGPAFGLHFGPPSGPFWLDFEPFWDNVGSIFGLVAGRRPETLVFIKCYEDQ